MQPIDLADFLLVAEAVTGLDAERLGAVPHVVARTESALAAPFAAFGDAEMYDGLVLKAAILCSRLLRNHPLPDGNKRVAYLCMIELIRRNGGEWRPVASVGERVQTMERLAAREVGEPEFAAWLASQVGDLPAPQDAPPGLRAT